MCSIRCKKNTWHVEFNDILQPPKYLIIVVNQFKYINNNFTKDKCSIPMDMTVLLDHHEFSLQATIHHHGPSVYSGHYTTSIKCCKKHSIATPAKLRSWKWLIPAYVVMYKFGRLLSSAWWNWSAFGMTQAGNLWSATNWIFCDKLWFQTHTYIDHQRMLEHFTQRSKVGNTECGFLS